MRIFLAADGSAGAKIAKAIPECGGTLIGLAVPETDANAAILKLAERQNIPLHKASAVKDPSFADWLRSQQTDMILSIHTSYIMCDAVLGAAKLGGFNLHPGPLPRYAGRNPVSWAIFHGEKQHGSTLHRMVSEIDAGPIVAQSIIDVQPNDTALELMARTSEAGVAMTKRWLQGVTSGAAIEERPQDMSARTYFNRAPPQQGRIYWYRTTDEILRFIRAYEFGPFKRPWPGPFTVSGETNYLVKRAARIEVADTSDWQVCQMKEVNGKLIWRSEDGFVEATDYEITGRLFS